MDTSEYTIVAEARGQEVLWFRRFGSYQGEWLLLAKDDRLYYLYKDWYGSCSGCDALEAERPESEEEIQKFIKDYPPFAEMRHEAALRIANREGNLLAVMPRNADFGDTDGPRVGRQLALTVKYDLGEIAATEILEFDNLELRRAALEKFGETRFVREVDARTIDRDGENVLMRIDRDEQEPFCFLYLKDGSTDRRYILRVDPNHETARAARAASFGFSPERFVLSHET